MDTKKTKTSLSKDVAKFLKDYDMTRAEFAHHLGRSLRHVYYVVSGKAPYAINEKEIYNMMDAWKARK